MKDNNDLNKLTKKANKKTSKRVAKKENKTPRPKFVLNGYKGYVHQSGRNVIYAHNSSVKNYLAKYNVLFPFEKKEGSRPLKADMFYSKEEYGVKITNIWDQIKNNPRISVSDLNDVVDSLFESSTHPEKLNTKVASKLNLVKEEIPLVVKVEEGFDLTTPIVTNSVKEDSKVVLWFKNLIKGFRSR